MGHDILCDSYCVFQIHDSVPYPSRNKDSLPRSLNELLEVQFLFTIFLFNFGKDLHKVVDCFVLVVLGSKLFALHDCLGNVAAKSHPSLVALKRCVPGRGVERVSMDGGP